MPEIPIANRKFREAQFFLTKLNESINKPSPHDSEEFDYNLSAFLSAARSTTLVLQTEVGQEVYRPWFDQYIGSLNASDQNLLQYMNNQRVAAVHQLGPSVGTTLQMVPVPEIKTERTHPSYGFHWFTPTGIETPQVGQTSYHFNNLGGTQSEVVTTCQHYLNIVGTIIDHYR